MSFNARNLFFIALMAWNWSVTLSCKGSIGVTKEGSF